MDMAVAPGHDVNGWILAFLHEAASPDDTSYDLRAI